MAQPPRLPYSFASKHGLCLQPGSDGTELVYRANASPQAFAEARRFAGTALTPREMSSEAFEQLLSTAYQHTTGMAQAFADDVTDTLPLERIAEETGDLLAQEDEAPVIRLINALLMEALREKASDIHIETYEKSFIVRLRVDGVLQEAVKLQPALSPLLVSRIKVMARLDIAEKRLPQDGRMSLRLGGREIDVRVSTMPAGSGERVVLRLLNKDAGRVDLTQLGLPQTTLAGLTAMIHKPHGIILITGPTGSGKTTTLYAMLDTLNDKSRNILTIEDPVEYQIEGIGQTQVNTKVDLTFARGLRAILRQDPDVVMVGEIRDSQTASIAVQASLTGHLVLSTLHTNSAIGAITRLLDMGVESFLLSSSIVGLIAQRLVRTLCTECREPYKASETECGLLEIPVKKTPTLHRAKGCPACRNSGYKGRQGIYEIITIDEPLRTMIHANAGEHAMEAHACTHSPGIKAAAKEKVLAGVTTMQELIRVTQE